jgi:tRNA A-37 threonylcarbamoyl transferase component Bud32
LSVFPRWQAVFQSPEQVFDLFANPVKTVQENNRGVVSLIQYNGATFVVKRSRIQENWRWAQFTSLYRSGEGTRTLRQMAAMQAAGLPVPEPVLALEKRVCGFVVASWCMYRYLEGQVCDCGQAHLVAEMLKQMHQQGWVHRDPHVENFLHNGAQIGIIDCAKARPWRSQYARMYDVVLLNNCCPGSARAYGVSARDPWYRLAALHNRQIKLWRRVKRIIRRQRP